MYFTNVEDLSSLKQQFRKLCMKHHPDKGGDENIFKEMYHEYEHILKNLSNRDSKSANYNVHNYSAWSDLKSWQKGEHIKSICPELTVEIIGSWLWVSGQTHNRKKILTDEGMIFSRQKSAWYWYAGCNPAWKKPVSHVKNVDTLKKMWSTAEISSQNNRLEE